MKTGSKAAAVAGIAAILTGCASGPPLPQVEAWLATGAPKPPSQDACPGVAALDLQAIERERAAVPPSEMAEWRASLGPLLPETAEALIPADASVVVRALLPAGGFYRNEVRSVVWKGADGVWMMWSQNKDYGAPPPPPPPPPPPRDSEDYAAWEAAFGQFPQRQPTDDERWPPVTGRLSAQQSATLEAALADPCRAWDPDHYPAVVPLRRPVDGYEDIRPCPPDGSAYIAEITEPARPRRLIGAGCINDTPTFSIITAAAYASPG